MNTAEYYPIGTRLRGRHSDATYVIPALGVLQIVTSGSSADEPGKRYSYHGCARVNPSAYEVIGEDSNLAEAPDHKGAQIPVIASVPPTNYPLTHSNSETGKGPLCGADYRERMCAGVTDSPWMTCDKCRGEVPAAKMRQRYAAFNLVVQAVFHDLAPSVKPVTDMGYIKVLNCEGFLVTYDAGFGPTTAAFGHNCSASQVRADLTEKLETAATNHGLNKLKNEK